ncbi:hypothetical protein QFU42_004648 [Escherichia coli]|nr:hypothetical protein [Escherichia coli]EKY5531265.1 hypothetical protein [Escherichia coli]
MLTKKMLLVCASCVALSACSAQEIAELNRQISDGAFAVTKVSLTHDIQTVVVS